MVAVIILNNSSKRFGAYIAHTLTRASDAPPWHRGEREPSPVAVKGLTGFLREHLGLRHSFAVLSDICVRRGREVSHKVSQVSVYTQSSQYRRISIRIYPDLSRRNPLCFYAILSFLPSLPG